MTTFEDDLKAVLADIKTFITLDIGESFTGILKDYKRVPSRFSGKETIELYFEINGKIKTINSISLADALVKKGVHAGQELLITKVAQSGNKITWSVEPLTNQDHE